LVGFDAAVDGVERCLGLRHFQHQQRQREGDREPDNHRPPRHRAAILADDEGKSDNGEDAEQRLQILHYGSGPDSPARPTLACGAPVRQPAVT
jgi:hypothetical protein